MSRKRKDCSPEEIKYKLNRAGWTFAKVDRYFGLKPAIAKLAARYPHINGELAIAEILKISPRVIWHSRFDLITSSRLKPQPSINYKPKPRYRHVQKSRAA